MRFWNAKVAGITAMVGLTMSVFAQDASSFRQDSIAVRRNFFLKDGIAYHIDELPGEMKQSPLAIEMFNQATRSRRSSVTFMYVGVAGFFTSTFLVKDPHLQKVSLGMSAASFMMSLRFEILGLRRLRWAVNYHNDNLRRLEIVK